MKMLIPIIFALVSVVLVGVTSAAGSTVSTTNLETVYVNHNLTVGSWTAVLQSVGTSQATFAYPNDTISANMPSIISAVTKDMSG